MLDLVQHIKQLLPCEYSSSEQPPHPVQTVGAVALKYLTSKVQRCRSQEDLEQLALHTPVFAYIMENLSARGHEDVVYYSMLLLFNLLQCARVKRKTLNENNIELDRFADRIRTFLRAGTPDIKYFSTMIFGRIYSNRPNEFFNSHLRCIENMLNNLAEFSEFYQVVQSIVVLQKLLTDRVGEIHAASAEFMAVVLSKHGYTLPELFDRIDQRFADNLQAEGPEIGFYNEAKEFFARQEFQNASLSKPPLPSS